jgi:hypothetical protein
VKYSELRELSCNFTEVIVKGVSGFDWRDGLLWGYCFELRYYKIRTLQRCMILWP